MDGPWGKPVGQTLLGASPYLGRPIGLDVIGRWRWPLGRRSWSADRGTIVDLEWPLGQSPWGRPAGWGESLVWMARGAGPWGKPVGQTLLGASPYWGRPVGLDVIGRWRWPLGRRSWSEDRGTIVDLGWPLGQSPWRRPTGWGVVGRFRWPVGHHSVGRWEPFGRFRVWDALGAFPLSLTAMAPRYAVDHIRCEGGPTCGMSN